MNDGRRPFNIPEIPPKKWVERKEATANELIGGGDAGKQQLG